MRSIWSEYPALRLLFPFMLGTVCCLGFPNYVADYLIYIFGGVLFIAFAGLVFLNSNQRAKFQYRTKYLSGTVGLLLLFLLGFGLTFLKNQENAANHFSKFKTNNSIYIGSVTEQVVIKEKSVRAIIEVSQIQNKNTCINTSGKLLVYFKTDSNALQLKYGGVILFSAIVSEIAPPQNPEEFNYKRYLSYHNVYQQGYLKPDSWKLLDTNSGNYFLAKIYSIRTFFLNVIKAQIKTPNEFGVASALMLGYNDFLTPEIMTAYSASGILHVLSVSGLHVGIVFLALNFVFGFLEKIKHGSVVKAILIIALIWLYAFLTGLCPSVLRSAMMFTMLQVGKTFRQNPNTLNIVAASCLFLLIWNPYLVTDVGFQLSYLAVFGIVYLYPKFYALLPLKNKLLDNIWGITCVSFAAQLATAPVSIFYFHQFPVWFLISNLIAIPLSNCILYTGMFLFVTYPIQVIHNLTGSIFSVLLLWLNNFIYQVDELPFALLQGLYISQIELILSYLLIGLICWFAVVPRKPILFAIFFVVLSLFSSNSIHFITNQQQKKLIVYSVPKHRAIVLLSGSRLFYDFDKALLKDERTQKYHLKNDWCKSGIVETSPIILNVETLPFGRLFHFDKTRVLIVNRPIGRIKNDLLKKLTIDYVIISGNPKLYLNNLKRVVNFKEIIFDTSNKNWRIKYWIKDCKKLNLNYYNVVEKGAKIIDLP